MIVLSVLLSSASSWGFKEELQTYKTVRLHWFTMSPRAEEWASHWKWSSDAVERPGEAVSTDKPLIFICCYFPSAGAVTVLPLDLRGRLKLFLWFLHLEAGAYERLSLWLLSGRRGAEEWITGRISWEHGTTERRVGERGMMGRRAGTATLPPSVAHPSTSWGRFHSKGFTRLKSAVNWPIVFTRSARVYIW